MLLRRRERKFCSSIKTTHNQQPKKSLFPPPDLLGKILPGGLVVFLILGALLNAFCHRRPARPSHHIEFIDGVKVVRNERTSNPVSFREIEFVKDDSFHWQEGDDYILTRPADFGVDDQGNVYILDLQEGVVKKYSQQGAFVMNIGRKGQGPGEFSYPLSLEITSENEIYIGDYMARKIEIYQTDGSYKKMIPVDFLHDFSVLGKGLFVLGRQTVKDSGEGVFSVGLYKETSDKFSGFFYQRTYWPLRVMDDEFVYEFPYFVRWVVDSSQRIYVMSGIDYMVSVFDRQGKLLFKFDKDFKVERVRGRELRKIAGRLSGGRGPNPFKARPVYPSFQSLSIDEEGRLWIERYQPKWRREIRKTTVYDVFSSEGIFLFTTKIAGHVFLRPVFRNGYLYLLLLTESGYLRLVRFLKN